MSHSGPERGKGKEQSSAAAVIMLNIHSDETYVPRCLRAGALGYVLKESAETELIAAIHAVITGKPFFSLKRMLQQKHVERLQRADAPARWSPPRAGS